MPVTKHGTCPWCEKHDRTLYFVCGIEDGRLWGEYICADCMDLKGKVWRGFEPKEGTT